jgi:hypothetical protein
MGEKGEEESQEKGERVLGFSKKYLLFSCSLLLLFSLLL